ncbi:MAG: hypothetical protein WC340_12720 [Kiritimatiellia bacterium]
MRKIELSGEWALFKGGQKQSNSAYIPGCIHGSLFDEGVIKDPFAAQNLSEMVELLQDTWSYEKVFVAEDLSDYDQVVLCFGGFTAPAEISLNNKKIATTVERFSAVEFSVKEFILAGKNSLVVKFPSLPQAANDSSWNEAGAPLIAESFGIWGDVSVRAYARARISDVLIETKLISATTASVSIQVEVEYYSSVNALEVMARICSKGNILSEMREEVVERRTVQRCCTNGQYMLIKGAEWVPADLYVARLTRVEYRPSGVPLSSLASG